MFLLISLLQLQLVFRLFIIILFLSVLFPCWKFTQTGSRMSNILKYKRRSTFRISKMNNRSIIFDHVHLQQKRSEINIMYSQECLRLRLYCIIQPSAER